MLRTFHTVSSVNQKQCISKVLHWTKHYIFSPSAIKPSQIVEQFCISIKTFFSKYFNDRYLVLYSHSAYKHIKTNYYHPCSEKMPDQQHVWQSQYLNDIYLKIAEDKHKAVLQYTEFLDSIYCMNIVGSIQQLS